MFPFRAIWAYFQWLFAVIFREGIVCELSFAQIDESNGILSKRTGWTVFVGKDEQWEKKTFKYTVPTVASRLGSRGWRVKNCTENSKWASPRSKRSTAHIHQPKCLLRGGGCCIPWSCNIIWTPWVTCYCHSQLTAKGWSNKKAKTNCKINANTCKNQLSGVAKFQWLQIIL